MKKLILLTALALFAGCNEVRPPIEARNDPFRPLQISYTDELTRNSTAVGDIKLSRSTADILSVTVPIRSTVNTAFYIDWRITFFDAAGAPMSNTGWAHHMLNPLTTEYLTGNSLSPGAKQFQIDLRRAE